ncbi:hypothetical protein BJY04DRAFT_191361 [Aspergillus karnatakaensis]|uniref:uncharacterized protein n=1 Tax=Aspergillus karnatakaensis TaxID=1810916 RepID=UPI003CCD1337
MFLGTRYPHWVVLSRPHTLLSCGQPRLHELPSLPVLWSSLKSLNINHPTTPGVTSVPFTTSSPDLYALYLWLVATFAVSIDLPAASYPALLPKSECFLREPQYSRLGHFLVPYPPPTKVEERRRLGAYYKVSLGRLHSGDDCSQGQRAGQGKYPG